MDYVQLGVNDVGGVRIEIFVLGCQLLQKQHERFRNRAEICAANFNQRCSCETNQVVAP